MNTANKLTLCRVVMIPIFIVLLYLEFAGHLWVALAVFILASITDFVDGYVAGQKHPAMPEKKAWKAGAF